MTAVEASEKVTQPRALLRLCLLLFLLEGGGHGYDLMERLRSFGLDEQRGSTYSCLRSLEAHGLVCSAWDLPEGAGPARRVYYQITEAGRARLAGGAADIEVFHDVLKTFLHRYDACVAGGRPDPARSDQS